jgi:hypothetical protein
VSQLCRKASAACPANARGEEFADWTNFFATAVLNHLAAPASYHSVRGGFVAIAAMANIGLPLENQAAITAPR